MGRRVPLAVRGCVAAGLLGACSSATGAAPGDGGRSTHGPTRDATDAVTHDARADREPLDDGGPVEAASHDAPEADVADAVTLPRPDAADAAVDTCADGAPVTYARASCPGTPPAVPASLASSAAAASFGAVVSLGGLDDSSLPCFPVRVCVASGAPTLLFSDEPESPAADGILYADALTAGAYRAYVYHVNAGTSPRKFPVVLLNQGTTTVHATVTAAGVAGPSTDYVDVGKQAALRWYEAQGATVTVDVPAGARVLLDADLDAVHAATNELAHAIVDFAVDGPVKLSVVSILATEDATTVTEGLSLLANTGAHMRGSFPGATLEVEPFAAIDGLGARHLRFGGDVTDAPLVGHDYVDNTSVTLEGNYGVAYMVRLPFAGGDGSAVLLSPQGGAWGGAALVTAEATTAGPGVLPASQDSLGDQSEAIVMGTFTGAATATVSFLSAGGSSLPVDLVTVPLP